MNKPKYTLAELVKRSVPYFASNPDVGALVATTHDGKFYRPEFESYAEHSAAKAGSEKMVIHREALLVPACLSIEDAMAEAGLVIAPVKPAASLLPESLGELVANATHLPDFLKEPSKPAAEPKTVNITLDTRPITAAVDAAVKKVMQAASSAPAVRRGRKPTAEVPVSAPAAPTRKPRETKPAAAKATATSKKTPTKKAE
ncbi:hypothetical protein GCM10023185_15520 [Hymenobacter saemangeumensis]|uniref:PRTRC system protein E n=1 Tax=Hymenobacter saemangeumensis TaxID=1084522 RepID=A0ABP8I9M4_9BACT